MLNFNNSHIAKNTIESGIYTYDYNLNSKIYYK